MQPDENFLLNHLHLLDPILCAWAPLKPAVEGKLTVLQHVGQSTVGEVQVHYLEANSKP